MELRNTPRYLILFTNRITNKTPENSWNYSRPKTDIFTTKAKQTLNILKALTSTKWVKQKELFVSTFKAITRPVLEYENTIWSPIISNTNIKKVQTIQNTALRITGCTRDTNAQHLHDETKALPMDTHLKLHTTYLKQLTQTQTHSLHDLNAYLNLPRNMKATIFHNNKHTNIIILKPNITPEECRENLKHIYTTITSQYLNFRKNNKFANTVVTFITTSYTYKTGAAQSQQITTLAKLPTVVHLKLTRHNAHCLSHTHDANHLFICSQLPTQYNTTSLWKKPLEAAEIIQEWESKLAFLRD